MVERILQDFDVAHSLRSISLRYFNTAGADPQAEIGEDHDPETHLIPLVLDAAMGKRPYVTVYGDDYDTQNGTCIRDYIHVTDLADAHILALQALQKGAATTAYNLGNGKGFSVKDVIETARQVSGCDIPVQTGPRRPGDPPRLIGDATRIRQQLGWNPQFADLDSIIRTAWSWQKK
jgi:UDP-glucose-4-epimerase GalE